MEKICDRCKERITDINKHYKYVNTCKACVAIKKLEYSRKKENICQRLYWDEVSNSKIRNHREPEYTKEALCKWMHSQEIFHKLYSIWVNSNYDSDLRVSIDRLDNYKGYSFNNIEVVTWKENKLRAWNDKKSGKYCSDKKGVYQYTQYGKFVNKFYSQAEAERQTGVMQNNITHVCLGKLNQTGYYIWTFKDYGKQLPDEMLNFTEVINPKEIVNMYDIDSTELIMSDTIENFGHYGFNISNINKILLHHVKVKHTHGYVFAFSRREYSVPVYPKFKKTKRTIDSRIKNITLPY